MTLSDDLKRRFAALARHPDNLTELNALAEEVARELQAKTTERHAHGVGDGQA